MPRRSAITIAQRDSIATALRNSLTFEADFVEIHRRSQHLSVAWVGTPTVEQVQAVCNATAPGVEVRLERTPLWSCGMFHKSLALAWEYHVLFYGNVPAIGDYDYVSVENLDQVFPDHPELVQTATHNAHWVSTCSCGSSGTEAVSFDDLTSLAESLTDWDTCRPGEFRRCPRCGGAGYTIDRKRFTRSDCTTCDQRGVFDMDDPDQSTSYLALTPVRS